MTVQPGEGTDVPQDIDIHTTAGKLEDLERRHDAALHAGEAEDWPRFKALELSNTQIDLAQRRVQLGTLVASLGFHEPAMLAKMAATVDAISGGRFILGVGAGWNRREYTAFGFPFDHRVDRFEEAFGVVRRLLAGETVTHAGTYYTLDSCVIDPPAARPGGPLLMLGSNSPRMLSIGLPYVHQWNVWWSIFGNTPEGLANVVADVRARTAAAGRDPDEVEATACVLVQVPGGAGRTMGDPTMAAIAPVAGSAQQVAEQLAAFAATGVAHLQLVVDPITQPAIEWLGAVLSLLDA